VPDQKLLVIRNGTPIAEYPVSTSRFGLGSKPGSYQTPTGRLEIAAKIGTGAPAGAVFDGRRRTGEVLKPNAPGRDPIVSRILCLKGLDSENRNAGPRAIYIHGTPVEQMIGRPASYGCVRMRSCDVIKLYDAVTVGTPVTIVNVPVKLALRPPREKA